MGRMGRMMMMVTMVMVGCSGWSVGMRAGCWGGGEEGGLMMV
jgi:hypothetical protein